MIISVPFDSDDDGIFYVTPFDWIEPHRMFLVRGFAKTTNWYELFLILL